MQPEEDLQNISKGTEITPRRLRLNLRNSLKRPQYNNKKRPPEDPNRYWKWLQEDHRTSSTEISKRSVQVFKRSSKKVPTRPPWDLQKMSRRTQKDSKKPVTRPLKRSSKIPQQDLGEKRPGLGSVLNNLPTNCHADKTTQRSPRSLGWDGTRTPTLLFRPLRSRYNQRVSQVFRDRSAAREKPLVTCREPRRRRRHHRAVAEAAAVCQHTTWSSVGTSERWGAGQAGRVANAALWRTPPPPPPPPVAATTARQSVSVLRALSRRTRAPHDKPFFLISFLSPTSTLAHTHTQPHISRLLFYTCTHVYLVIDEISGSAGNN